MRFKHLFAEPQEGESLHEFFAREQKAWRLRHDELVLAMDEGCSFDVDIEARLREKGLIAQE